MYAEFFSLRELPFNNTPDPRYFYSTPDHEEALASLLYAVSERKGFVLLTGEVGAGKTLVSRMMLRHFGSKIAFANINHPTTGAADLLEAVCSEFELPCEPGTGRTQTIRVLHDFLLAKFAQNVPVVLVLDEAQSLAVEAFEQLRMIGNLEADDAKLLQIAFLGQPELRTLFQSPALRQLRQRLFTSFHLPQLNRQRTEGYILHRLRIGGAAEQNIFDASAMDRIYEGSEGIPRTINTICDNAMLSAYSADRHTIDGAFVDSVIAQMMTINDGARASDQQVGGDHQQPTAMVTAPAADNEDLLTAAQLARTEERLSRRSIEAADIAASRIDHLESDLRGRVLDAVSRLETLERHAVEASEGDDRARKLFGEFDEAIREAKTMLPRLGAILKEVNRKESQVAKLVRLVKTALGEMRSILEGIGHASANTRKAERQARQTCDRLAEQSERTGRLTTILRQVFDRLDSRATSASASRELQAERFRHGRMQAEERAAGFSPRGDTARAKARGSTRSCRDSLSGRAADFEKLLANSRETLSDLRGLIQETSEVRVARSYRDPSQAVEDTSDSDPPAARLARQVQSLLELVESDAPHEMQAASATM